MQDIYAFLTEHDISYEEYKHPAVFTCEQAQELLPDDIPGADTKNLFLRDKNGRKHILVIVGYDKKVDLHALSEMLELKKLGFGSPERLLKYLGITPGSVSMLALMNDLDHEVQLYMDEELWKNDLFRVHPLVNTASLVIDKKGVEQFIQATGHELNIVQIP